MRAHAATDSPTLVRVDPITGVIDVCTNRYQKSLRDICSLFADQAACHALSAEDLDGIAYEVWECRPVGGDLIYGTTVMQPGRVSEEYFMTRGHIHRHREMGEIYHTQAGRGVLLLCSSSGDSWHLEMTPGTIAHIPPGWAHRSVNVGDQSLIFTWAVQTLAGNVYADFNENMFSQRVYRTTDGGWTLVDGKRSRSTNVK